MEATAHRSRQLLIDRRSSSSLSLAQLRCSLRRARSRGVLLLLRLLLQALLSGQLVLLLSLLQSFQLEVYEVPHHVDLHQRAAHQTGHSNRVRVEVALGQVDRRNVAVGQAEPEGQHDHDHRVETNQHVGDRPEREAEAADHGLVGEVEQSREVEQSLDDEVWHGQVQTDLREAVGERMGLVSDY